MIEACIDDDEAAALVQGALEHAHAERVRTHAEECTTCRAIVAGLARMSVRRSVAVDSTAVTTPEDSDPVCASRPGELIAARYVLGEVIGAGAMGVVYSARDTTLARTVALKRVRAASRGTDAHDRLVQEARTMAQLSHPSVVTVFDAGVSGGAAYVAMEHVDGVTLRSWLAAAPRSERDIARAFAQAARGLAAAHAAGIVHGDFKPDNVLVDGSGRVRVADFGLARAIVHERDAAARELAGTIAYMAPEQLAGAPPDPASDQYAFCVSLYEALHGARPPTSFRGAERRDATPESPRPAGAMPALSARVAGAVPAKSPRPAERADAHVEAGRALRPADAMARQADVIGVRSTGPARRVASWLERVCVRGLDADPAKRFPRMDAVAEALDGRRRPTAWWIVGGVAAAGAAVGAALVMRPSAAPVDTPPAPELRCPLSTRPSEQWNAKNKEAIKRAFAATKAPYADGAFASVARVLDEYARAWSAASQAACEATHVQHTQSEPLLDLRTACLEQRVQTFDALIRVFANADGGVVENAPRAAVSLDPIAACAELASLVEPVQMPADAAVRAEVARAREQRAQSRALFFAGKLADGRKLAATAVETAARTGFRPVEAETLSWRGHLEGIAGDPAAEATLGEAILAGQAGRHAIAVGIAHNSLIGVQIRKGRLEEAIASARSALSILESRPAEAETLATTHTMAGFAYIALNKSAEAQEHFERAIAIEEAALGSDDPRLAKALNGLAGVHGRKGDVAKASAAQRRALAILERAYGPDHPELTHALTTLGNVMMVAGDAKAALAAFQRGAKILEANYPPGHAEIGRAYNNIGHAQLQLDDHAAALVSLERSLAIRQKALTPDNPDLARTLLNLGLVHERTRRFDEALAAYKRALAILEPKLGPRAPEVGMGLTGLGRAELAKHRPEAVATLERAVAALQRSAPTDLARAHEYLAHALREAGREPAAIASARKAVELYRSANRSGDAGAIAALEAFVAGR